MERDSESILVGCEGGRGVGDVCECVPGETGGQVLPITSPVHGDQQGIRLAVPELANS